MADQIKKSVVSMETKSIDEKARTIEFIGTNSTKDRSGDIIETDGWFLKNFMENPVFLWAHDGRSRPPIGRALEVSRTPNGLKFLIEFASKGVHEFADTIFKLYVAGFLKGVSVGFVPRKTEIIRGIDGEFEGIHFIEQELVELSAVSVPDNPDAMILEAVEGVLRKEAAEFLSKSLEAEITFGHSLEALKKEIILMTEEEKLAVEVKDGETEKNKGGDSTLENKETELDIWKQSVENRLEQLTASVKEQKSATEMFERMASLLEGLKSLSTGEPLVGNKFLSILGTGIKPKGDPKDVEDMLSALGKFGERVKSAQWKSTS